MNKQQSIDITKGANSAYGLYKSEQAIPSTSWAGLGREEQEECSSSRSIQKEEEDGESEEQEEEEKEILACYPPPRVLSQRVCGRASNTLLNMAGEFAFAYTISLQTFADIWDVYRHSPSDGHHPLLAEFTDKCLLVASPIDRWTFSLQLSLCPTLL